eukprot:gnl/Ergobibamus_cyprinoides/1775.p3 GENE.gnl/Ergobibamus_cyprinoides/1775~~gnl/Ergobibamus_cyprinoides/1775.p3  ORF type:complete len:125 (+),score=32.19 gnl/Ergobibamus_cyprinoides/1775:421-795(+)
MSKISSLGLLTAIATAVTANPGIPGAAELRTAAQKRLATVQAVVASGQIPVKGYLFFCAAFMHASILDAQASRDADPAMTRACLARAKIARDELLEGKSEVSPQEFADVEAKGKASAAKFRLRA